MVGEFVVWIAIFGADDASGARVASQGAIQLDFDAMGQTFRNVPSSFDADSTGRAGGDAGARGASRAWVEAERVARRIEFFVDQERGAKSDPRSVYRMHRDAQDASVGDARDVAQLGIAESPPARHEGR